MYCCFSFWAIFSTVSPLTTQKIRILKNEKKHLEISSFYTCVWSNDVRFLRYSAWQMDQQIDGKRDIQSWVPHLKILIFFSFANMQVCNINWKNIELWKNRNLKRIHVWYFGCMHIFGRTSRKNLWEANMKLSVKTKEFQSVIFLINNFSNKALLL